MLCEMALRALEDGIPREEWVSNRSTKGEFDNLVALVAGWTNEVWR
jgi:hypothetical protein